MKLYRRKKDLRPFEQTIPEYFIADIKKYNEENEDKITLDYLADLFNHIYCHYLKEEKDDSIYITLSSAILERKYGKQYTLLVKYLENNSFISLFRNHLNTLSEKRCRLYKINRGIVTKHKNIRYTNYGGNSWDGVPKLIRLYQNAEPYTSKIIYKKVQEKLLSNLKAITIDYPSAIQELEKSYDLTNEDENKKYQKNVIAVENINNNQIYFTFDKYGRVHTNLTTLKKEIRQKHILIENQPIAECDIPNSQPLFLAKLISDSGYEIDDSIRKFFDDVIEGRFYEQLGDVNDKKTVKKTVFGLLFGRYCTMKAFKDHYPGVVAFIKKYKKQKGKFDRDSYKKLSHKLQQLESEFIFNKVCNDLSNRKVKYFTVHDSICVAISNEEILKEVFNRHLNELKESIKEKM